MSQEVQELSRALQRISSRLMSSPPTPRSGQSPVPNVNGDPEKLSLADQEWIDRLTGKLTRADDTEALREADLLRAAILREHEALTPSAQSQTDRATEAIPGTSTSAEAAGAERLMFALRREGLLPHPGEDLSTAHSAKARRPAWMMPTALAASILVGFFALQALQLGRVAVQYDEPPTMRGQIQEISIRNKNPKAKAEMIVGKFKEVGLSARIYQSREQFVVDADVVSEKIESATKALGELGLEAKVGQARITIQTLD